jgi:hypothetical protein
MDGITLNGRPLAEVLKDEQVKELRDVHAEQSRVRRPAPMLVAHSRRSGCRSRRAASQRGNGED